MLCDDNYVGDLWEDQAVPFAEADLIAIVVSLLTKGQGGGGKKKTHKKKNILPLL